MSLVHKKPATVALALVLSLLCASLVGCGSKDAAPASGGDDSGVAESQAQEDKKVNEGPRASEAIDAPVVDNACGNLMVSDGKYLYLSYRTDEEEGGLYRTDLDLKDVEMIDRGWFSNLRLHDGALYYLVEQSVGDADLAATSAGESEIQARRLDLSDLSVEDISGDDYLGALIAVEDPLAATPPEDVRYAAAVGDKAYFIEYLGKVEGSDADENSVPRYNLSLSSYDSKGAITPTGVTWQHQGTIQGLVSAYGDYVFYATPWERADSEPGGDEARTWDVPCCYNTKTGEVTALVRPRELATDVYVIDATGDYMLVDSYDDPHGDGLEMCLEGISDSSEIVSLFKLVEGAKTASALESRDAAEKAAEEEALRNEPYGPGTSTLVLSAPKDKSACYRLVRMDGSTEFMVNLGPGEETTQSFPSGRYTLKTAEGDTWISDEEAFGESGHYSTTDVYTFKDGGSYTIGGGISGDFRSDDASGFTS